MTAARPATRRINRGRSHEYVLDGVKCDGVTTLINGGVPKPALTQWAARAAAELVVQRRSILTELSDDEVIDLIKGAPFRDRDRAANRGTAVHGLAAKLGAGEDVEVPPELVGHVDAYIDWLHRWQPEDVLVERVVINRRYRYMGTLDVICRLPGMGRTLLDIKTNRSGPYGEAALQLVAYGRAETMLVEGRTPQDVTEGPMPAIDSYGVLWLTTDSWEFYPYDCGEREWRAFLYAAEVCRWVRERADVVKGTVLARPPLVRAVS